MGEIGWNILDNYPDIRSFENTHDFSTNLFRVLTETKYELTCVCVYYIPRSYHKIII